MKAKEFLKQYYWLDKSIAKDRARLNDYRCAAEGSANRLSKMPGAAMQGDIMSHYAAKAADLSTMIDKRMVKLLEKRIEIEKAINKVEDPLLNMILKLRYIDFLDWQGIQDEIGYCRQHTWRYHSQALLKVEVPE